MHTVTENIKLLVIEYGTSSYKLTSSVLSQMTIIKRKSCTDQGHCKLIQSKEKQTSTTDTSARSTVFELYSFQQKRHKVNNRDKQFCNSNTIYFCNKLPKGYVFHENVKFYNHR